MATEEHEVSEKTRTYEYANGDKIVLTNVESIRVSESGNHYLKDGTGRLIIVAPGWQAIFIVLHDPSQGWTF